MLRKCICKQPLNALGSGVWNMLGSWLLLATTVTTTGQNKRTQKLKSSWEFDNIFTRASVVALCSPLAACRSTISARATRFAHLTRILHWLLTASRVRVRVYGYMLMCMHAKFCGLRHRRTAKMLHKLFFKSMPKWVKCKLYLSRVAFAAKWQRLLDIFHLASRGHWI